MEHVLGLKCTICGQEYGVAEAAYVCPKHGDEGILDVVYNYRRVARNLTRESLEGNTDYSMWRYRSLLPVLSASKEPPLKVGWTPLYPAPRLAARVNLRHLWVKDDSRQPTGSFKDRASAVAVVKAQEAKAKVITTASTGNAAAALAGMAASVAMQTVIFVPRSAPPAKIAQHLVYGAKVLLVDGSYDDAFELTLQVARDLGWYNRNTAYNPYMAEGKKTAALELCEQLGWNAPDRIFVPVGDGCILAGIHKGLKDLLELGFISHMPKLMGVQAEGSASLVDAWERGLEGWEMVATPATTVADSICSGFPRDRIKALSAVRQTGGAFIRVSDQEILSAIPELARNVGVFTEPAGAAASAGLAKAVFQGMVSPDERVVILATGSGLKDIASVMRSVQSPQIIPPSLEAAKKALQGIG